jgi:hypothetical protein
MFKTGPFLTQQLQIFSTEKILNQVEQQSYISRLFC